MEIQLQELIDQIKNDGVKAAESQSEAILASAKAEAEKIIADAKAEAEKIIANAQSENARIERSAEDAIRQAGRNLLISFRESVARELNVILAQNVSAVYSSENLANIVINVVESWAKKENTDSIELILNSESLKSLENIILAGLKDRMIGGVTLKANDNFDGGFRIAVNDSGAYYDYSAEAVVDMLSNYLSPKITNLLKEA
jgi:V/A-type H+-transporting ATPase subunit E